MSLLIQTPTTFRRNRMSLHTRGVILSSAPAFAMAVRSTVRAVATVRALRGRLDAVNTRRASARLAAHVEAMLARSAIVADCEANTVHVGYGALAVAYAREDSAQWPTNPMGEVFAWMATGITDFFDAGAMLPPSNPC